MDQCRRGHEGRQHPLPRGRDPRRCPRRRAAPAVLRVSGARARSRGACGRPYRGPWRGPRPTRRHHPRGSYRGSPDSVPSPRPGPMWRRRSAGGAEQLRPDRQHHRAAQVQVPRQRPPVRLRRRPPDEPQLPLGQRRPQDRRRGDRGRRDGKAPLRGRAMAGRAAHAARAVHRDRAPALRTVARLGNGRARHGFPSTESHGAAVGARTLGHLRSREEPRGSDRR